MGQSPLEALKVLANNPSRIEHYMSSLIQENKAIKEELQNLSIDLVSFTNILGKLIDENKSLSFHLQNKDIELHQIIETLTINESEEIKDLRHTLISLTDENSVLIKHLDEMKIEMSIIEAHRVKFENQHIESKRAYQFVHGELEQTKVREEGLSREYSILKKHFEQELEQKNKLLDENKSNQIEITKYEQDVMNLQREIDLLQNQVYEVQSDKNQKVTQLNLKIYELNSFIDQIQGDLKLITQQRDGQLDQLEAYLQENNQLQVLCDSLAQQNDDITNKLLYEAMKQKQLQQNDIEQRDLILKLEEQVRQSKFELQEATWEISRLHAQLEQDIQQQKTKFDTHLQKLKSEFTVALKEKDDDIAKLENDRYKEDNQLEELRNENQKLHTEIVQTKQEMHDYQQQTKIIESLQLQLRQAKNQIKDDKQLIHELTSYKGGVSADLDERDKKIMEIIKKRDEEIDVLQKDNERLQDFCQFLEDHKKSNEETDKLNYQYKQEKEILEQENSKYKQEIEFLKQENNRMKQELRGSRSKLDQSVMEENRLLKQQIEELQSLKPVQKEQSIQSRSGQGFYQKDFQETKPKQGQQIPPSPGLSRSPSVRKGLGGGDESFEIAPLDDENPFSEDKSPQHQQMQFSFDPQAAQQQQQQYSNPYYQQAIQQQQGWPQQQYQQQYQQYQQYQQLPQPPAFVGRPPDRKNSQTSSLSNQPYRR
ncbi:hypothetical protein pb186bvf_007140 [Paramecium bursaria]